MDIIQASEAESGIEWMRKRPRIGPKIIWCNKNIQNKRQWMQKHANKLFIVKDKQLTVLWKIIDKGSGLPEDSISKSGIWYEVGDKMAKCCV